MSSSGPKTFSPPGAPPVAPTYSQISSMHIGSGYKLLCFAGQVGVDAETGKIPSTLAVQVEIAFRKLDMCLEAAGATKKDIVKVTQYVVNLQDDVQDGKRAQAYMKFMGELKPPSTLIGVQSLALKELLYEIEAMAVVKE